jgi:hypothetical protein
MISNSPEGCVVDIVLSDSIHDRYIFIINILFLIIVLICIYDTPLFRICGYFGYATSGMLYRIAAAFLYGVLSFKCVFPSLS